jgi:hypothetical protein
VVLWECRTHLAVEGQEKLPDSSTQSHARQASRTDPTHMHKANLQNVKR